MFSKTSFKAFKHKAKKGMMEKIGKLESRPEDPNFMAILSSMETLKRELKEIQFQVYEAARAGKHFNNSLEHLCGSGIKGEALFNKEDMFVSGLQERLGPTLDQLVMGDVPKMDDLVVSYDMAKLNFDSAYFATVKDMRKKEVVGADVHDTVMQNNVNLPALQTCYLDAKKEIINQKNFIKGRLENEVLSALIEVHESSDAKHHHLYIDYMKKRIALAVSVCEVSSTTQKNDQVDEKAQAEKKYEDDGVVEESNDKLNQGNSAVIPSDTKAVEVEKTGIDGTEQQNIPAGSDIPDVQGRESLSPSNVPH